MSHLNYQLEDLLQSSLGELLDHWQLVNNQKKVFRILILPFLGNVGYMFNLTLPLHLLTGGVCTLQAPGSDRARV